MTNAFDLPRLRWLLLSAKTCAAIALLFALTMPLMTCSTGGSIQQHRVMFSRYEIGTIASFVWPIPLLFAQFFSGRVRRAFAILVLEWIAAVFAWAHLTITLLVSQVVSLGGIHPGDGFDLATSAIIGYLLLSATQATLGIIANRATAPVSP